MSAEGPSLYESLRDAIGGHRPVVLATVVDGRGVGAKLLVGADGSARGTLGDPGLDRVVGRDALG